MFFHKSNVMYSNMLPFYTLKTKKLTNLPFSSQSWVQKDERVRANNYLYIQFKLVYNTTILYSCISLIDESLEN